ncbi:Gfo/Idh/MocA family protein [Allomesorhizobium alhagi]|jgi:predicted dehydrogenase|uniref:GFO/IDH/MocA family oxidoreductase n=1 Tax=Mesorhizobium alhagi CCNWXJ12-2 TaxID=1107882 RepID=H0HZJ7_9HYPH|nr:Gfo/Idh/MocA family oxidoreductase [Mesorhizobium alhagi]EHK53804.1 GFO/IDH/MocA family oxidoreductase [Mesorhizobium alhagi CCNWXJ12-2]
MSRPLRFAAIGLDHRHIYHQVGELIEAGAECAGYCPETSDPRVLDGFRERFPALQPVERERLFDDPLIDIVVSAAIPRDRPAIAIRAMRADKDVMVDKPGATMLEQVAQIEAVARETGRIFSICFSERFVVRACEAAVRMVAAGEIGKVVQTVGLGPHRLNRAIRPAWFFERDAFGGILTDIASHQIDQFLFFTGARDAEIVASATANHALPDVPDFEDFGEILLRGGGASGFIRVDWFTPDGLGAWGDGRLFLLGTEGYIELRKYIDVAGREGADHLFISNRTGTRHIDASGEPLTYFRNFLADVRNRTSTAMPDGHALSVTRLAVRAQVAATRLSCRG